MSVKKKGDRGEVEFAAVLSKHFNVVIQRRLGAARDGGADIIFDRFSIEVKRQEVLKQKEWWAQAVRQAGALCPVLAYRRNRASWRVIVPLSFLTSGEWNGKMDFELTAELSLAGFFEALKNV